MLYTPDFVEFLGALNRRGVRYLIIGGYAVAFHGYPRATKDLDLWLETSPENARRALEAIRDFFGETLGLEADDLVLPGVVQLGYAPNRIDLVLLSGNDPAFEAAYERAPKTDVSGVPVRVVSKEDLLTLKRAFGRTQDLADADALEEE
ncbi:hypothetical protein [Oceanithermus sp.]